MDIQSSDFDLCWLVRDPKSLLPPSQGRSDMGTETPLSSSEGKGGSDGKNKSWLLSNVDPNLYELANLLKNLIESKDKAVPKSTVLEKVIFPHIQKRPGAILMLTLIPTQRYKSISKIKLGV